MLAWLRIGLINRVYEFFVCCTFVWERVEVNEPLSHTQSFLLHEISHCNVVLPNACSLFLLDIFFMSIYKLLPQKFSISQMPVLFQLLNSFLLNDSLQYFFASRLIFKKGLLLYELLNSINWSLIDTISIPQLLVRLFRFIRALLRTNLWPLTSQIVCYNLCLIVSHNISQNLCFLEIKPRLVRFESEHLPFNFTTVQPLMALGFIVHVELLR